MDTLLWPTHLMNLNGFKPLSAQNEMKKRLNAWTLPASICNRLRKRLKLASTWRSET